MAAKKNKRPRLDVDGLTDKMYEIVIDKVLPLRLSCRVGSKLNRLTIPNKAAIRQMFELLDTKVEIDVSSRAELNVVSTSKSMHLPEFNFRNRPPTEEPPQELAHIPDIDVFSDTHKDFFLLDKKSSAYKFSCPVKEQFEDWMFDILPCLAQRLGRGFLKA
jgi:hypothetical protein